MIPEWFVLLPILFPLMGGMGFALISARFPKTRVGLAMLFLALELAAILVNIAPGIHRLTLSSWDTAAFTLGLRIDGITLILLAAMIVPLFSFWLVAPPRNPFDLFLMAILTAAIFVAIAATPLTIYVACALLDLALFLWRTARAVERETALRGFVIGQLGGLILLAGIVFLDAGRIEAPMLMAIAFWLRLGIFPFHYLLPARGNEANDLWFARGLPIIAAANLWLHWSTLKIDPPITVIGILASLAFVVTAIWIWREEKPARAVNIASAIALAPIPLTIALGSGAGLAMAFWQTLAAGMALALFEMAQRWRVDNMRQWQSLLWFLGVLSFAGIPLTPAFLGRVGLFVVLLASGNGILLLLIGAASLIVLAALWNIGSTLKGAESRQPRGSEYLALGILGIALLALGFLPTIITPALGAAASESTERVYDLVIRTTDALGVGLSVVTLALPLVGAYLLQIPLRQLRVSANSSIARVARFIDLDWLEHWLVALGYRVGVIARNASTIAEANPTVWLLLVALWIAIFIVTAR